MSKVIHKFTPDNLGIVDLPVGKVLSIAVQHNTPVVYLEREVNSSDEATQVVMLVGTGWEFNSDGCEFIGTVVTHGDSLVHHAYIKV